MTGLALDASALVPYLLYRDLGPLVAERLARHQGRLHLPHLAVVETTSVIGRLARTNGLSDERARSALEDLRQFPARRWPAEPLLARVWQLRHNFTAYDAVYVALAESLGVALLTHDARLAAAVEQFAECAVEVV